MQRPPLALAPDAECFGLFVHARASDWRVGDALATVREMRERGGLQLPEFYAALLRRRCRETGVTHPDVPEHPVGWMFSPRIMAKKQARSPELRKQVRQAVRGELRRAAAGHALSAGVRRGAVDLA